MTLRVTRWLHTMLPRLFRRSAHTHASVAVRDLSRALNFYRRLGFRRITASRNDEVVLLRNARGDELNLCVAPRKPGAAEFAIDDLDACITALRNVDLAPDIDVQGGRVRVEDPDGNRIAFFKQRPRGEHTDIFHITTAAELAAGLSEHFYLPPNARNRFVQASPGSALIALTCARVAQETSSAPVIVALERASLNIEAPILFEADIDKAQRPTHSSYPHVTSPINRQAITGVGICRQTADEYVWPDRFQTAEEVLATTTD
ncbi:MAG: VOC family protein [Pseudomonadota bacterium]